jgi:hypothetical protein
MSTENLIGQNGKEFETVKRQRILKGKTERIFKKGKTAKNLER